MAAKSVWAEAPKIMARQKRVAETILKVAESVESNRVTTQLQGSIALVKRDAYLTALRVNGSGKPRENLYAVVEHAKAYVLALEALVGDLVK